MKQGRGSRWLAGIAGIVLLEAAVTVEVGSVLQAVRHDSWAPIYTIGWLPVVVVASVITWRRGAQS